jgi:hypothetical protein
VIIFGIGKMHTIDVNYMKLKTKQKTNNRSYIYTFIIGDVITDNPIYSKSALHCTILPNGLNQLLDLDNYATNLILAHMKDEYLFNNQYKMLVIDITNYPYVTSYFDYRDQSEINKNALLSKITCKEWDRKKFLPTVLINLNIYHTNLKLLPINI